MQLYAILSTVRNEFYGAYQTGSALVGLGTNYALKQASKLGAEVYEAYQTGSALVGLGIEHVRDTLFGKAAPTTPKFFTQRSITWPSTSALPKTGTISKAVI